MSNTDTAPLGIGQYVKHHTPGQTGGLLFAQVWEEMTWSRNPKRKKPHGCISLGSIASQSDYSTSQALFVQSTRAMLR